MDRIIQAALAHSRETAPNECCGLVIVRHGKRKYVRCRNISPTPHATFVIDPEDYANAEDVGEIVTIVHSHNYIAPQMSEADKVECERSGVPWLIVNFPEGNHALYEPCGYKAPLIGRQFHKGTLDCYALVKDYYAEKLNIVLPDYVRPDVWFEEGRSILLENFKAFGFKEITREEMRENDCMFMQIGSSVPNHCAVYIGAGQILHHMQDCLSSRDVYGGYLQKVTTNYLRYVG